MTDVSQMSDAELMAFIQGGQQVQPVNAQTGASLPAAQSAGYNQLAAAGGIDPRAEGGSPRLPLAQGSGGELPAAGKYYMTPDGKVLQAPAQNAAVESVRAIARGVPVAGAFADEANAAINAGIAPIVEPMLRHAPQMIQNLVGYDPAKEIGGAGDYGDRFDASMNLQRFRDDSFDAAHPNLSLGMRGVGMVGGSVAALPLLSGATAALPAEAGLIPRMATGALEGGAIGGAQGYGTGGGDWNDVSRLRGAGQGALFGSAAGAALPAALTGAGAAWKASGGKVLDMARGNRPVVKAPSTQAEALAAALRGPGASEVAIPDNLAIPGAAPQDLAEIIAARSATPRPAVPASAEDDAIARIARAMARQGQTPEQMVGEVQSLGPRAVLADSGEAMRDLLRDAGNRPSGAGGIMKKALDLRQNGEMVDGQFTIRPSSTRIADQAAEGLGVSGKTFHGETDSLLASRKAEANPAYAKAYAAAPVDIGELRDFAGSKLFRDAYGRARSISEKEFVKLPDGTEQIVPLPDKFTSNEALDWRTLDLMKQGLDDLVKEGRTQGIGANEQGAIKGYLNRFRDKLDSLNPDYKAARDAFGGPTAMVEAMDAGRAFIKEDAPLIGKAMAGLSKSEQEMYRLGVYQALKSKLGDVDVTYDAARQAGVLKPNQLERLSQVFPTPEAFGKFVNGLTAEQRMFQTRAAATGNSTTAKQLSNMADSDETGLQTVARGVVDAKTGNVLGLIQALSRAGGPAKMSEPTSEALASILTNMDQAALPGLVDRLSGARASQAMAEAIRRAGATAADQAAASAGQPRH